MYFFTVNHRGTLYRLAGLPMGWKCSNNYSYRPTEVFIRHLLRTTAQPHRTQPPHDYEPAAHATKTLPALFAQRALERRHISPVQGRLLIFCQQHRRSATAPRPHRSSTRPPRIRPQPQEKPMGTTQICEHLGLHIDTKTSTFRAPPSKLHTIATLTRTLLQRSTRDARWLPARRLAVLAGKAQYLYLAIPAARFYLRELHNVLATRAGWGTGKTHL
jgi:hypothetical protein